MSLNLRRAFTYSDSNDKGETMALTGSDLKNHLACTGNISVRFYRANNIRRKSLKRRKKQLPQLQEYEEIPEQLLKGSTVSLNTRLVCAVMHDQYKLTLCIVLTRSRHALIREVSPPIKLMEEIIRSQSSTSSIAHWVCCSIPVSQSHR